MSYPFRYSWLSLAIAFLLSFSMQVYAAAFPGLVTTDWLQQHLNDEHVAVIDMSDTFQYQRFHIPGARHLPYSVLTRANHQRVSVSVGPDVVTKILAQLGITPEHTVIVYDDSGGLNAARLYWELQRLQHGRVGLLDGGLVKWIREGRKISWQARQVRPTHYPLPKVNPLPLANKDDVAGAEILLDVRTLEEYQGHPRQPRSGHIPSARHFPWDAAVRFEQDFTMKSDAELRAGLADLGLKNPNQEVVLYCRSGHRAAHSYFTLKRLGWQRVRVYDGSMAEYELDKSAPLKKGRLP